MRGFAKGTYGDAFADVYDDWYADVTDVDATIDRMVSVAGASSRVLELGVGTGRLAVPLALAGPTVVGVDSSQAMLDRLDARLATFADGSTPSGATVTVTTVCGDMVADLPDGPFDAALVAYNTLFNLLDDGAQQACFHAVAARLVPGGAFVVEVVVPDETAAAGSDVSVRSMTVDRVVLSVSDHRPAERTTSGQFVEFTESGGVRLRPWAIRWSSVAELDAMAQAAGFVVEERLADMAGSTFDDDSTQHVTIYRLS